jgi:hypothetical protein
MKQINEINDILDTCATSCDGFLRQIYQRYSTKNPKLPKRGQYPFTKNSVKSLLEGVIDNMSKDTKDFTVPVLKGLSTAFDEIHNEFTNFEPMEFNEVQDFNIVSYKSMIHEFFEIEIIIRKKQ